MKQDNEKARVVYKKMGETPLQTIERFRDENEEYADVKLSYAGRLDPMAEGALLIVIGEENKQKDKYLGLDKEYVFDILFGFNTDTYDILGKVTESKIKDVSEEDISSVLETFKGERVQEYPPFSSKTVEGKPLFQWAREGKLNEIEIPINKVTISEIKLESVKTITETELKKYIFSNIDLIKDYDFRQGEIKECWDEHLSDEGNRVFTIATVRMNCSGGTYVRSLVHSLGKNLVLVQQHFIFYVKGWGNILFKQLHLQIYSLLVSNQTNRQQSAQHLHIPLFLIPLQQVHLVGIRYLHNIRLFPHL